MLSNQIEALLFDLTREGERIAARRRSSPETSVRFVGMQARLAAVHGDLMALAGRTDRGELSKSFLDLQTLRKRANELFAESLALATAPAIRTQRLDEGACDIADRLLIDISRAIGIEWPHFTTLAESEFFGTSAQIVRLRYPGPSVWDFAVAVHELGHFCGPNWPPPLDESPYEALMARTELGPGKYREEYFADLFAVFVLGPAYAWTCVIERFDPIRGDSDSHPADIKRVAWILRGLELLAQEAEPESAQTIQAWTQWLQTLWDDAAATCKQTLDPGDRNMLRTHAAQTWSRLRRSGSAAMYGDLRRAMLLAADYRDRRPRPTGGTPDLRDVLTAAWLVRLETTGIARRADARAVERWAMQLLQGDRV